MKTFRQIAEVSYLAVENSCYRSILRYFYLQHVAAPLSFPDEVYDCLTQSPHFAGYTGSSWRRT